MRLIDIAVNLTDPMFVGCYRGKQVHPSDFNLVLQRARAVGITKLMCTGTSLEESIKCIQLAKQYPGEIYATVGCHPTRCHEFDNFPQGPAAYLQSLSNLISQNKPNVVAIGECGLDYDRLHFCDRETQLKHFKSQLQLAQSTRLPLFLHNRGTNGEFVAFLTENRDLSLGLQGVVHSFDGSIAEARSLMHDFGLYIGINGCSLKTQQNLDVVRSIPLSHIMVETDAPWCSIASTHASYQFKTNTQFLAKKKERFEMGSLVKGRNEPCEIINIIEVLAKLHGKSSQQIADATYENAMRVFFP